MWSAIIGWSATHAEADSVGRADTRDDGWRSTSENACGIDSAAEAGPGLRRSVGAAVGNGSVACASSACCVSCEGIREVVALEVERTLHCFRVCGG